MENWQTIGFEKQKKFFKQIKTNGNLAHAYLFTGQEMIGKKTFAIELTSLINRVGKETKKFNNDPNILVLTANDSDSGKSISVDQIRSAKSFLNLSPYSGAYKFLIVNDAHLMTVESQNSLLKILEEPSHSSIIFLITANPSLLLETVVSRCQEIYFPTHSHELFNDILLKSKLSKNNQQFLLDFCGGRMGLLINIVNESLFPKIESASRMIMNLAHVSINERFSEAQKLTDEKKKSDLVDTVLYWILYLRTRMEDSRARKILKNLLVLHESISRPQFNQRLALENFLVRL